MPVGPDHPIPLPMPAGGRYPVWPELRASMCVCSGQQRLIRPGMCRRWRCPVCGDVEADARRPAPGIPGGVSPADLVVATNRSNRAEAVAVRRRVCRELRQAGMSLGQIGYLIGRHHTTVLHLLREGE